MSDAMPQCWPFFAAAVMLAMKQGVNSNVLSHLASLHVIGRAAYSAIYVVQDNNNFLSWVRSAMWCVAQYCTFRLLVLAAGAGM